MSVMLHIVLLFWVLFLIVLFAAITALIVKVKRRNVSWDAELALDSLDSNNVVNIESGREVGTNLSSEDEGLGLEDEDLHSEPEDMSSEDDGLYSEDEGSYSEVESTITWDPQRDDDIVDLLSTPITDEYGAAVERLFVLMVTALTFQGTPDSFTLVSISFQKFLVNGTKFCR